MPKHYTITGDDQVVEIAERSQARGGVLPIVVGKFEEGDQRFTMKADPSLVKEYIRGKEAENLGRTPIMVYDYSEPRWAKKIDSWTANAICFVIGAGLMGSAYYWGFIHFFAK